MSRLLGPTLRWLLAKTSTGNTPSFFGEPGSDMLPWYTPESFSDEGVMLASPARFAHQAAVRHFPKGSVLVVGIASIGKLGLNREDSSGNQQINCLTPKPGLNPQYLAYSLKAQADWLRASAAVATLPILNQDRMKSIRIPYPTFSIQAAIADFLDRKTAAIDTLIAKKEELITRLEQYRQSLITETVSRGLVAGAATRASGIAGMGAIPAHWRVAKTGQVLRYVKGKAVSKEDLALDGEPAQRFWRTGDFWNLNGREKDEVYVTDPTGLVWKNEGELVICFDGFNSEVGKGTVGMARFEGEGYIDSHLELITQRGGLACKKFLEYAHCTAWMEGLIVSLARGAIAYSAGFAKYDLQIPLPPLAEQEAIAAYLDAKLATFYEARTVAASQVAMLKEYRASLIAEAVTGKLAVS